MRGTGTEQQRSVSLRPLLLCLGSFGPLVLKPCALGAAENPRPQRVTSGGGSAAVTGRGQRTGQRTASSSGRLLAAETDACGARHPRGGRSPPAQHRDTTGRAA